MSIHALYEKIEYLEVLAVAIKMQGPISYLKQEIRVSAQGALSVDLTLWASDFRPFYYPGAQKKSAGISYKKGKAAETLDEAATYLMESKAFKDYWKESLDVAEKTLGMGKGIRKLLKKSRKMS